MLGNYLSWTPSFENIRLAGLGAALSDSAESSYSLAEAHKTFIRSSSFWLTRLTRPCPRMLAAGRMQVLSFPPSKAVTAKTLRHTSSWLEYRVCLTNDGVSRQQVEYKVYDDG